MHWIYLIIAVVLLLAASKASGWLVVLLLAGSLILLVAWMLGWISSRISSGARHDAQIIAPDELRRLREQASARKNLTQSSSGNPPP